MKIQIWIASTTHIDGHNERVAKSALDGMAEQIKQKYIPRLIEHDWNRQIGVGMYWEVFQLNDWEYALWVVYGIFENEEEKNTYKTWGVNTVRKEYQKYLNINELIKMSAENIENNKSVEKQENNKMDAANMLEMYINSTGLLPTWEVYKIKRFIAWTWDLRIEIYPGDHDLQHKENNWPHFHIISKQKNFNARFDLETFEYVDNKYWKISDKDKKKVKTFLLENPEVVEKLKSEYERLKH